MKLIKLTDVYKGEFLINPERIIMITKSLEKKCLLRIDDNEIKEVSESESEILKLIEEKRK